MKLLDKRPQEQGTLSVIASRVQQVAEDSRDTILGRGNILEDAEGGRGKTSASRFEMRCQFQVAGQAGEK
jgi:hypothetical protein